MYSLRGHWAQYVSYLYNFYFLQENKYNLQKFFSPPTRSEDGDVHAYSSAKLYIVFFLKNKNELQLFSALVTSTVIRITFSTDSFLRVFDTIFVRPPQPPPHFGHFILYISLDYVWNNSPSYSSQKVGMSCPVYYSCSF